MKPNFVSVYQLVHKTKKIISQVNKNSPVIVTVAGIPRALIVPLKIEQAISDSLSRVNKNVVHKPSRNSEKKMQKKKSNTRKKSRYR